MIAQMEDKNHPEHLAANFLISSTACRSSGVPVLQCTVAWIAARSSQRRTLPAGHDRAGSTLFPDRTRGTLSLAKVHAALTEHYAGQDIVEVVPLEESTSLARVDAEGLPARTV